VSATSSPRPLWPAGLSRGPDEPTDRLRAVLGAAPRNGLSVQS